MPNPGDSVLYHPSPGDPLEVTGYAVLTATVASEPVPGLLDLAVLMPAGNWQPRANVMFIPFGDDPPAEGTYCTAT